MPYSRAIEVNPATNEIVWKYQDKPSLEFLLAPNGLCAAAAERKYADHGVVLRPFEVTKEGEIVWEYVNPFFGKPLFGGREGSESNQVFRAYRYSEDEIARFRRSA